MSIPATGGYVLHPEEGRAIWFLGGLLTWKAVGRQTDDAYELVEQLGAEGFAAPLHTHDQEAEGFFVLDGDVTFVVGDKTMKVSAGGFAHVPPHVPHSFRVDSPTARFLTLITPPGLEQFVEELGTPATDRNIPSDIDAPVDPAAIEAVAVRYGQQILGPPPGPLA